MRRKASTSPTTTQTNRSIPTLKNLLPHLAGQKLKRVRGTDLPATTTNLDAAAVVILLQATATCLPAVDIPPRPYLFHLKEDMSRMTLIMTPIRPEIRRGNPAEARKEMRREARTTETMTDTHGTTCTPQSHVSAVTSLHIENHLLNNIHALDMPLQTPNLDLLGAIQPTTVTIATLVDPAAPRLTQAMMRETDDVKAIAHGLAKQTPAMADLKTVPEAETGIVHLLMAAARH